MRKMSVLLGAVALTAALSGCVEKVAPNTLPTATTGAASQTLAGTTASVTGPSTQAQATFPAQLIDLAIQDEAGNKLNLKDQAPGKPRIIIFWASW